jgi:hypothetical protein
MFLADVCRFLLEITKLGWNQSLVNVESQGPTSTRHCVNDFFFLAKITERTWPSPTELWFNVGFALSYGSETWNLQKGCLQLGDILQALDIMFPILSTAGFRLAGDHVTLIKYRH